MQSRTNLDLRSEGAMRFWQKESFIKLLPVVENSKADYWKVFLTVDKC